MFEVEHTDVFEAWYSSLSESDADRVDAAVSLLAERGPGLGRPLVDTLQGSAIPNLKELRIGAIRILFVFDPRRVAILLMGGDKRERWQEWYREAIPVAEEEYAKHLAKLGKIRPDIG